jgi:CRISPR-associated protein Cas5t
VPGTTSAMRVAKIRIHAPVVSFRYPHFLVGRHVTFDMPPPSTIYGHLASALGGWPDPSPLRFSYEFTFVSKGSDLEHQHIIWPGRPEKLSTEESARLRKWQEAHPLAVGGAVQPTPREFLFGADLTLYLQPADLALAFRSPVFPVVLGRSQDLASIISVQEIDLMPARGAYFENTLLPFSWRPRTGFGATVLMSRFISPPPEREPVFDRYVVLRRGDRVFGGEAEIGTAPARRLMGFEKEPSEWWVDPASKPDHGVHRGVLFLSFRD